MRISFIGGGVMAESLISGILKARLAKPNDIRIGEPSKARSAHLKEKYKVGVSANNLEILDGSTIVILAVKPQILSQVMNELGPRLNENQVVLSIIAGATLGTLMKGLEHSSIIRVMPNTPAQIGAGMTVWTTSTTVSKSMTSLAQDILCTLGKELYVPDEKLMDMATALSASGPAYIFLFIEALIDAGVYLGMPREMARKLVIQTVMGSTMLVQETGKHPADLKDLVSSPGGGTVEALMTLEQTGFRGAVLEAVSAAYDKYVELGKSH